MFCIAEEKRWSIVAANSMTRILAHGSDSGRRCVSSVRLHSVWPEPSDLLFARHVDKVAYVCRLCVIFQKNREESTVEKRFEWSLFYCFVALQANFYLVRIAVNWCRELVFERRQRLNEK